MTNLLLIFANEFKKFLCRHNISQMNPERKNSEIRENSYQKDLFFIKLINLMEYFQTAKSFPQRTTERQMGLNKKNKRLTRLTKNIKNLRRSRSQFLNGLFVLEISENSAKNVSTPETQDVTKYRPHDAVSLL